MIKDLSLKAIREQITSGMRDSTFVTDDGGTTEMVYIPKFTIPAGAYDGGAFPAEALNLGGFFIDKYQCSHQTGDNANIPVSLPGRIPWANVNQTEAKTACAARLINGVACHLPTMKEWATVCFLTKLLGHDIHGNNNNGKDYRDSNTWGNFGVPDKTCDGRVLTGTGPVSWSCDGTSKGVFDIVGNVWEWMDFNITDGIYTHKKTALINDADGITAVDTTITLDTVEDIDAWPETGLILIGSEYITYGAIDKQTSTTAVLSGCTRGANSSTAATHANDVTVYQLTDYCVIPGGATAYLTADISASATSFAFSGLVNGPDNDGFAVGDTLQMGTEQAIVTAVESNTLTVSRGANGSTAITHTNGDGFTKISPQMNNADPAGDAYQYAKINTMRFESDLAPLVLPKAVGAGTEEWKDGFWIRSKGSRAALRGGHWSLGGRARSGFCLDLINAPSSRHALVGFRAALSI
jgi:hypothetical protein